MSRKVIVLGLVVVFFCSCGMPALGSVNKSVSVCPAGARAGGMDIPTWHQGDVWTYSIDPLYYSSPNGSFTGSVQNFRETIVGTADDAYEVAVTGSISGMLVVSGVSGVVSGSITGTSYMRISDLAQESSSLHSEGTITVIIFPTPYTLDLQIVSDPSLELFDFPLNVGEQWAFQGEQTTIGSFNIQGLYTQSLNGSAWVDESMVCDVQESISVPAGSFDCLKVSHGETLVWYSDDAGNIVKTTVDQSDANMTVQMTQSLVSFSRATQPLTITETVEPAITFPGASVLISGQVRNTAPVPGALVLISIPSLDMIWNMTTDANGMYAISIIAPTMTDDTPSGRETGSGGVMASCSSGGLSGYMVRSLATMTDTAPGTPVITGPAKGKIGIPYNFTVQSTDPESDDVLFFIDWGDNTTTNWLGPSASGAINIMSHTYTTKGTYTIKVKAKDVYGMESAWGTLQVTWSCEKISGHPLFSWFFERFPHAFPILRHLLQG
jgi:hypothetical protein